MQEQGTTKNSLVLRRAMQCKQLLQTLTSTTVADAAAKESIISALL